MNLSALWRKNRYACGEYVRKLRAAGIEISPLLFSPGMQSAYVCIDSLHAEDIGFALDAIGNFFWLLVSIRSNLFPETSIDKRGYALWARINSMYTTYKTTCRLQTLTREMSLKQHKHSTPKLRAKDGECRHLLHLACEISAEFAMTDQSVLHSTISATFAKLFDYQMSLGVTPFHHEACAKACRDCCTLYKGISDNTPSNLWKIKPKIHMFQELCEYMAPMLRDPSNYWNYRNESYVGFISSVSSSRGGVRTAAKNPKNVLQKCRALAD